MGINYNKCNLLTNILYDYTVNNQDIEDIINIIKALMIDNIKERYNFIYDKVCDYLDNKFINENICEFKNDICLEKRKCNLPITMGCCHRFVNRFSIFFSLKPKTRLCPELKNKHCSIKSISCKLFTCSGLNYKKLKFTPNNIKLLKYTFNIPQKIILICSLYKNKEITINRLLFFK